MSDTPTPDAVTLSIDGALALAKSCLSANGADEANASAVADTVASAERDGAASHGLFRIPGYVKSLRSGKVNGRASPAVGIAAASVVKVDGDGGFAPLGLKAGRKPLVERARETGVAVMSLTNMFHFAALWPETEALAEQGLAAIACTGSNPFVAPAGARTAFFGTNPLAFAWPDGKGGAALAIDMATSETARGEVMLAKRDGHMMATNAGLDKDGDLTNDPADILDGGVQVPFGGYKGSAISLMVELLAAGLTGELFSHQVPAQDVKDGGPPRGGEFLIAMDPARIAGDGWAARSGDFLASLLGLSDDVRLPGKRRHENRAREPHPGCFIPKALVEEIKELTRTGAG